MNRQEKSSVCSHEKTAAVFKFFATYKHSQKHKQNTSKDAEFIALHNEAILATSLKCSKKSNHKNRDCMGTPTNCIGFKIFLLQ